MVVRVAAECLDVTGLDKHRLLPTEEGHVKVIGAIVVQRHHHAPHTHPDLPVREAGEAIRHPPRRRLQRLRGEDVL